MNNIDAIQNRIQSLIEQGMMLRHGDNNGACADEDQMQRCRAWITAARHIVSIVVPDEQSIYRAHVEEIGKVHREWYSNEQVGEIAAVLTNLLYDLREGLLTSIVNQTRADVFDDFLDHARAYLEDGSKNQAGVIAGVVFEDTIRRIARNQRHEEKGEKLDSVISSLAKSGVISSAVAKRCRAAAHVRTKATHAQWEEFSESDTHAAVTLTDEMILKHLES